jgi:hypothetical protein
MGDIAAQVVLIIISVGLSTVVTLAITRLTRWREHQQSRLLVASEIIANWTKLHLLVNSMGANDEHNKNDRLGYCLQFDKVVTYNPPWQRERWLSVKPGAFSADQLYLIDDWYSNLEGLSHGLKDMAAQSQWYREWRSEASAGERASNDELIVSKMAELEKVARDLYARPRPYIDLRIDAAHEKLLAASQAPTQEPST